LTNRIGREGQLTLPSYIATSSIWYYQSFGAAQENLDIR